MTTPLPLTADTSVLVLTGAGISAESGIPTFRGAGGFWRGREAMRLATPEAFAREPELVWEFYGERRTHALGCEPNAAHRALAQLEEQLGDRFFLLTQNVDGLHMRAGSTRLAEMHGRLFETRCSSARCPRPDPFPDMVAPKRVPQCAACGAPLRPNVVWFGEAIENDAMERGLAFMDEAAAGGPWVFLAVGTSGAVMPAAMMVDMAKRRGARTVLVSLEGADNSRAFDEVHLGKAGEVLPRLLAA
jgi:NAD-dependent deacetylase